MKYTVTWLPDSVEMLAEIWTIAHDRRAVTVAANHLDRLLESNPLDVGEERAGADRIAFEPPLQILFRVDLKQRLVLVTMVGQI